jgi:hypothetical protein
MNAPRYDWAIVAPWWSWPDPARTPAGRATHPILQKYATSDPVTEFLADPQRCLRYVDDDVVPQYQRKYIPLRKKDPPPPPLAPKMRVLAAADAVEIDPSDGVRKSYVDLRVPRGDGLRKIFLDTHGRFYLVVCQIHCDAPGFPKVAREKVLDAGFVVRRRTTEAPAATAKEAKGILKNLSKQRAHLQTLDAALPKIQAAAKAGASAAAAVDRAKLGAAVSQRAFVAALLAKEQQRLAAWAARLQVAPTLQGWFPAPGLDRVGRWQLVEETPADLGGEATFPLYPLIPSDDEPNHAGHFGTVYFGLLPAHLADHDANGRARFKEQEYYEVRCWAKRRKEPSPGAGAPCECFDKLFWSAPTDPYWLAGHYDLVGTSQRPVTIQLPDLKDLAADPKPRLGVIFSKPPGSLSFRVDDNNQPQKLPFTGPNFQICSLPIPLITIVATFVLELFLPIIVFLFGLFWMLLLKFCIPPEIDVGAGLTLELEAQAPSLDVHLDASGSIDMGLTSDAAEDSLKLTEGWKDPVPASPVAIGAWASDLVDDEYPPPYKLGAELKASCSAGAIVNWQKGYRAAGTTDIPSVTDGLEFVEEKPPPKGA